MEQTNKISEPLISSDRGALILIEILYSQNLINKATYDNIQRKYNKNNELKDRLNRDMIIVKR